MSVDDDDFQPLVVPFNYTTGGITPAAYYYTNVLYPNPLTSVTTYGSGPYTPPKEKSEAVIAGEIIGWRLWKVNGNKLRSMYIDVDWEPGVPMRGNIDANAGVHAYKTEKDLRKSSYLYVFDSGCPENYVYGQVALWGDVVEHTNGYRAEFGKPVSLYPVSPKKRSILNLSSILTSAIGFFFSLVAAYGFFMDGGVATFAGGLFVCLAIINLVFGVGAWERHKSFSNAANTKTLRLRYIDGPVHKL